MVCKIALHKKNVKLRNEKLPLHKTNVKLSLHIFFMTRPPLARRPLVSAEEAIVKEGAAELVESGLAETSQRPKGSLLGKGGVLNRGGTYIDVRRRTTTCIDVLRRTSTYDDVRRRTSTYVDVRRRTSTYVPPYRVPPLCLVVIRFGQDLGVPDRAHVL